MPDPFQNKFAQMLAIINRLKPILVKKMGAVGLIFIRQNFEKQAYYGATVQQWKHRNPDKDPGRPILQGKGSVHLMRAPFVSYTDSERARITANLPYAKIHNEGGVIQHSARSQLLNFDRTPDHALWRLGKTRTDKQRGRIKATIEVTIGAHTTNMPRRQYMPTNDNPSPVLDKMEIEMLTTELENTFKDFR